MNELIPSQFRFHYTTHNLAGCIDELSPFDVIDITVKAHGTPIELANVLCRKKLTWWQKLGKFFDITVDNREYSLVWASRKSVWPQGIHSCVARDFGPYIDERLTVYGEVVGYCEGEDRPIRVGHTYGCKPGTWKFMPYRITSTYESGAVYEWSIDRVLKWTDELIERVPSELKGKIMKLERLYNGRFGDLYNHLYENVAARLTYDDYIEARKQHIDAYGELPEHLSSQEAFVMHKWRIAFLEKALTDEDLPLDGIVLRKQTGAAAWKL